MMQSVLPSQLHPHELSLNISQLRLRRKTGNRVEGRKFWFLTQSIEERFHLALTAVAMSCY